MQKKKQYDNKWLKAFLSPSEFLFFYFILCLIWFVNPKVEISIYKSNVYTCTDQELWLFERSDSDVAVTIHRLFSFSEKKTKSKLIDGLGA